MNNYTLITLNTVLDVMDNYPTEIGIYGRVEILAPCPIPDYVRRLGVQLVNADYDGNLEEEPLPIIQQVMTSTPDDYYLCCSTRDIFRKMIETFDKHGQAHPYHIMAGLTKPLTLNFGQLLMLCFSAELGDISKPGVKSFFYDYPTDIGIQKWLAEQS